MKQIKYGPGENPNGDGAAWVSIVCGAESHAGRTCHIAAFVRAPGAYWQNIPGRSIKDGGGVLRWARQELLGDRALSEEERASLRVGDEAPRVRYAMRCELCDESVPVRHETLVPRLDRLAGHADVWELDLTELRAIVA